MSNQWEDATSYSRDDTERSPKAWSVTCGPARLVVTKGHVDYPGEWIMHAYGLGIERYRLGLKADVDPRLAQLAAKNVAVKYAEQIARELAKL